VVFCSSCGKELPKSAYFCPNCGVRTGLGVEAGVGGSWDEVKEGFSRLGEELEKAFERVGREIERAFEGVGEARAGEELVVCPKCREENVAGAKFCYNCGKKLK